jgi:hypothetical protein
MVLVFLGSVLLLHCERGAGEERGPQGSEGEPPVVDLRRPPPAAPPVPWFDTDIVPARPQGPACDVGAFELGQP